jgi:hypothetical protein
LARLPLAAQLVQNNFSFSFSVPAHQHTWLARLLSRHRLATLSSTSSRCSRSKLPPPTEACHAASSASPRLDLSSLGTNAPPFLLPWPFDFKKLTPSKSTTGHCHSCPSTGRIPSFSSYKSRLGAPPFFPGSTPLITFFPMCPTLRVHTHQ